MGSGRHARRMTAFVVALALPFALAACQSTGGALFGGSPAGVPVAIEIMDGPPDAVRLALKDELAVAAANRSVEMANLEKPARYTIRGYITAQETEEGAALAYVWDVFDAQKQRARRLEGSTPAPTSDWAGLDGAALSSLAGRSMDEIARFLAETKNRSASADGAPTPSLAFAPE